MLDLVGVATPLTRGLILTTLLLLTGTVAARALVERVGIDDRSEAATVIHGWLRRLPGLLAWFLLTLSLLRGALQVLAFTDPGAPIDPELARAVLSSGSWGAGWLSQTLVAFIVLALTWLFRETPRRLRWTVALGTLALLLAQSGMGHGVEAFWNPLALGRIIHFGHLLGAGIWLGTLAVLGLAVFPSLTATLHRRDLVAVLGGFSTLARVGALVLVASGVVATFTYTNTLSELWTTTWGKLLLAKILLFAGVASIGYWNWRVVTPRLQADDAQAGTNLRRAIAVEIMLAALLIAVTAVLVGVGTPREM
jgi:putative copper export protein